MKIVSCFVREQKRYTKNQLKSMFSYDEKGVEKFIKTLKAYGILKTVHNNADQMELSDLLEEDLTVTDESVDNNSCLYVFNYVGILVLGSRIIKCYPKYILSKNENDKTLLQDMIQIIKVLEKYNHSSEQIINFLFNDGERNNFNILAIMLYLLNDYYEYGVYNNSEDIVEVNGEGPILWERTINNGFAIFQDNRPYYVETYTSKNIDDEEDYIKNLHECILTRCSDQLESCHLDEIFEIEPVFLSENQIEDFGDKEYILDRILKELNLQYNTRRQTLLKTMYAYIANDGKLMEDTNTISMFGTTGFHMVWEKVCSEVFDNKLHTCLSNIHMKKPLSLQYDRKSKLIDIIEKPLWECFDVKKESKETFIPDLIAVEQMDGEDYFIILDAKYYNLQLEKNKKLKGNPGISDISKQYLYQLAYQDFLSKQGITHIKNYFLMPTEEDNVIDKGCVSLRMMKELGLEDIQIRFIPAKKMYELYLSNRQLDVVKCLM